jgi:hypothetical protein
MTCDPHAAGNEPGTARRNEPTGPGRADQVVRRINFSQAHPEVNFLFHRETGRWEAACPANEKGTQRIYGLELEDVLDHLEERFGKVR